MAFTVIDFETTGFVPEGNDRVVEVGVVLIDDDGRIEEEWTSLVNPRRDVGPTHIHGLRGADLIDAPDFSDIADQILGFVVGRTVVAHNASFDMRFLQCELLRAGYDIPKRPPALCSMKWAGRLVGPAKLAHVCDALGVQLIDAHSAMADARATSMLLTKLMRLAQHDRDWSEDCISTREYTWPTIRGGAKAQPLIRGEQHSNSGSWLKTVLNSTWVPGVPEDEASYLLILDRALLDRKISKSEARQLVDAAEVAGLSGVTVERIHRSYLESVAQEALEDGTVTAEEKADRLAVANALGLDVSDVNIALERAAKTQCSRKSDDTFSLTFGDRIVFTGETSRPREEWVSEIVAAGLTSGGISKSTKLVVAADPDSLSGKAVKARSYAIPIVDEKTFVGLFEKYQVG